MRTPAVLAMLAGLALVPATSPSASAHAPGHHMRVARTHPFRGAYHIRHFDQAEAEAEVHVQYLYRTPYLPYWVFP